MAAYVLTNTAAARYDAGPGTSYVTGLERPGLIGRTDDPSAAMTFPSAAAARTWVDEEFRPIIKGAWKPVPAPNPVTGTPMTEEAAATFAEVAARQAARPRVAPEDLPTFPPFDPTQTDYARKAAR